MEQNQSIRTEFLQQFTAYILRELARQQPSRVSLSVEQMRTMQPSVPAIQRADEQQKMHTILPFFSSSTVKRPQIRQVVPQKYMQRLPQPFVPKMQQPQLQHLPQSPQLSLPSLTKIASWLTDPAVISIECPGPDKPLVIMKGGFTQNTSFQFTQEEIAIIMDEISQKTRIPLGSGVFKAALGNFLFTAISSKFIGTRFLIQKK